MITSCKVTLTKFAEKQLQRIPKHIQASLSFWVDHVERFGVQKMRLVPGYHDEALKGSRSGQRSARLSRAYRVIYEESDLGTLLIITILEVNKHDYS